MILHHHPVRHPVTILLTLMLTASFGLTAASMSSASPHQTHRVHTAASLALM